MAPPRSRAGTSRQPTEVVLGTSLPMSGQLASFGISMRRGYERAVDEVNAEGGLRLGRARKAVRLEVADNGSSGDEAGAQARDLVVQSGAVALLGPATSQLSIPVSVVAEQLRVPVVHTLTPIRAWQGGNSSGWSWSWDVFFDETRMTATQFEAADLVETNRQVALFTDQEEDGFTMGGLWTTTAPQHGYRIAYHAEFPVDCTDLRTQVGEAKASGAEVLIAQVLPTVGVALLREMAAQEWHPRLTFLEKAGNTGAYPEQTDGLANGTYAANWFTAGLGLPSEEEFIERYSRITGGVNSDLGAIVAGYTIAQIVIDAIRRAGTTSAPAVNEAIGQTDAVYPLGRVTFDDFHCCAIPVVQTRWNGDDMVLVAANGTPLPAS